MSDESWPTLIQFGQVDLAEYAASQPDMPAPPTVVSATRIADSLASRRAIYGRNGVSWLSARSWRRDSKAEAINALRLAKIGLSAEVIEAAAADVSAAVASLFGPLAMNCVVTTTPVGHSRRPDSFAVRLAGRVAELQGRRFAKIFADRFVSGSSHPMQFSRMEPIRLLGSDARLPPKIALVVDDVATSGWHMEEALGYLRAAGSYAVGAVWISGTVK